MPLPMVHLCVAKELSIYNSHLKDFPEFYLGVISPDAIHMRMNTNREDKGITHLVKDGKIDLKKVVDFLRQYKGTPEYYFMSGYGIHILTDYFWNQTVYMKFVGRYNDDFNPLQPMRDAYYNDTDSIDIKLYNESEWRPEIWEMLSKAQIFNVSTILSKDEIFRWNLRTLNWYDNFTSHLNERRYISHDEVTEFCKDTGKQIRELFETEGLWQLENCAKR